MHHQVREFVHRDPVVLAPGAAHHDEVVRVARLEERGGELVRPVGFVVLLIAKGDDANGLRVGQARPERLHEEAAHLFEMAGEVAAGALTGGGVQLEVRRRYPGPRVFIGGAAHRRKREHRGGSPEAGHYTGSLTRSPGSSMWLTSAYRRCVRATRSPMSMAAVGIGSPICSVTTPRRRWTEPIGSFSRMPISAIGAIGT